MHVKSRYLSPKRLSTIRSLTATCISLIQRNFIMAKPHIYESNVGPGTRNQGQNCRPHWTSKAVQAKLNFDRRPSEPSVLGYQRPWQTLSSGITMDVTPTVTFRKLPSTRRLWKDTWSWRVVTEAAKAVCGHKSRDNFIWCIGPFSTANADIWVKTLFFSLNLLTVCDFEINR